MAGTGTRKGSPNKRRFDIEQRLKQLDCDPLESMVRVAKAAEASQELSIAGKLYSDICKYVHPQLKAVEITGEVAEAFKVIASKLDERI